MDVKFWIFSLSGSFESKMVLYFFFFLKKFVFLNVREKRIVLVIVYLKSLRYKYYFTDGNFTFFLKISLINFLSTFCNNLDLTTFIQTKSIEDISAR